MENRDEEIERLREMLERDDCWCKTAEVRVCRFQDDVSELTRGQKELEGRLKGRRGFIKYMFSLIKPIIYNVD